MKNDEKNVTLTYEGTNKPDPSLSDSSSPPDPLLNSLQSSYSTRDKTSTASPIMLDHIELTSAFKAKIHNRRIQIPKPISFFFNQPVVKYGKNVGSIGGDYHASSNGRRILNAFLKRDTERSRNSNNVTSTHNLLTEKERLELLALANGIPLWAWSAQTFANALMYARAMVLAENSPNLHMNDEERFFRISKMFYPITCPSIEFYREYPIPPSEEEFFKSLERAISSCFGDIYETQQRKKYSRRWRIKAFNGERGRVAWIKCYKKGNYFRLEVQIKNPPISENVSENLDYLVEDIIAIGNFASAILNSIDVELDYQFPSTNVAKLEELLHAIFPRSLDSKRFGLFIKCIAETNSYTPSDHLKSDRISRTNHLIKMTEIGILQCHRLPRIVSGELKLRHVKKYFYTLAPNWEQSALNYLESTST